MSDLEKWVEKIMEQIDLAKYPTSRGDVIRINRAILMGVLITDKLDQPSTKE